MSTYAEDNITMTSQKSLNDKVNNVNQYFWYEETGTHAGAHITEVPQDDFKANPQGGNLLAKSNGLAVRDGMTERATFGADGQSFNNEYSEPILEVRYLDNATYSNKLNWWEYSGENPFTVTFPWDCNGVNSVQFYDVNHVEISLGIAPVYTLVGRELTFDSATCTEMIAQNVSYVSANYIAEGGLPYYTLGSDGVGSYGSYSTRIGENTVASGNTSLATGDSTVASGANSHAEGLKTTASGAESHSEGYYTVASGNNSHAEGSPASENDVLYQTIASGLGAHAEGAGTQATGNSSHSEGFRTTASGEFAHAEGAYSQALGRRTHAGGIRSIAQGYGQTVIGKYNEAQGTPDSYAMSDKAFIIGNGSSDTNRSNAFTVDWQGNVDIKGEYRVNGTPIGGGGGVTGVKGDDESTYRTGNVNIAPADLGEADFVVEQNVSSGWTYRKWNSGIAEMWCTVTTTARTNTSDGGGYVSESAVTPSNFPFNFTDIPNVQCTVNSSAVVGSPTSTAQATVSSAGSWKLYRVTSNTSTSTKRFNFYVIGNYK